MDVHFVNSNNNNIHQHRTKELRMADFQNFTGAASYPAGLGSPNPFDPAAHVEGMPLNANLNVGESTLLSDAMASVLALAVLYYCMSLARAIVACNRSRGLPRGAVVPDPQSVEEQTRARFEAMAVRSEQTTRLIPMLAILILFTRLRARVDLEGSEPPEYTRNCFYAATAIVYARCLWQEVFYCRWHRRVEIVNNIVDFTMTIVLYVVIGALIYSVCTMSKQRPQNDR